MIKWRWAGAGSNLEGMKATGLQVKVSACERSSSALKNVRSIHTERCDGLAKFVVHTFRTDKDCKEHKVENLVPVGPVWFWISDPFNME